MFFRQLDLTTALRPSLLPDETLLFVQDAVGLYEGKYKIPAYQNGHAYLTSHRACYVDNEDPRKNSVAIDLRDVDRPEFYAGFLKSSAKVTLYPKPQRPGALAVRSPVPVHAASASPTASTPPSRYGTPFRPSAPSPSPALARDPNATWVCPICSFSNPVPSNFDPGAANANTPLPPCLACGIKPPLAHVIKAAIAAMSNRGPTTSNGSSTDTAQGVQANTCARCTFQNHPSLTTCEICGAPLSASGDRRSQLIESSLSRSESPGPSLPSTLAQNQPLESVKFSFRAGGEKPFYERLKSALVQRKWLLQNAPPIPTPNDSGSSLSISADGTPRPTKPIPKRVGIAGLERRDLEVRKTNELVIGSAFEDLEALMTSAKEVIAMAERFAAQSSTNATNSAEASALLTDLGLVTTRDMLSPSTASTTSSLYITELARQLAEFLTDDARGVLRREGGIISLVDLWALFNRTRNGIELIAPRDFEAAAARWEALKLPLRLRRFKSGVLVVQGRDRTDEKTLAAVLAWLRTLHVADVEDDDDDDDDDDAAFRGAGAVAAQVPTWDTRLFGRGVTAQECAEHFGWSVGVASEELDMCEEAGALCREVGIDGVRFWENYFALVQVHVPRAVSAEEKAQKELRRRLREHGLM